MSFPPNYLMSFMRIALMANFQKLQLSLIYRLPGQIWQILQISAVICRILHIPPDPANSKPKFLSKKLAKVLPLHFMSVRKFVGFYWSSLSHWTVLIGQTLWFETNKYLTNIFDQSKPFNGMIRTNQTHKNYIGTKPVMAEFVSQISDIEYRKIANKAFKKRY